MSKALRSADFKHLLWRRHPDANWWKSGRPEIIATDGREVRRLSSQHQHIAFQAFEDSRAAHDIASKIEWRRPEPWRRRVGEEVDDAVDHLDVTADVIGQLPLSQPERP